MSPTTYYILHVVAAFTLVGVAFAAAAAPKPERRRPAMMLSGIAGLVMLVAGIGLLHKLNMGFPGWVILKIVCFLVLSAMVGIAFRREGKPGPMAALVVLVTAVAVWAVYTKPF
jgi:hypothetical protein